MSLFPRAIPRLTLIFEPLLYIAIGTIVKPCVSSRDSISRISFEREDYGSVPGCMIQVYCLLDREGYALISVALPSRICAYEASRTPCFVRIDFTSNPKARSLLRWYRVFHN